MSETSTITFFIISDVLKFPSLSDFKRMKGRPYLICCDERPLCKCYQERETVGSGVIKASP